MTFLTECRTAGYAVDSGPTGSEGQLNARYTMPDGALVELQEDRKRSVEVSGNHIHFRTPHHELLLDWILGAFDLEARPRGTIQTSATAPGMNLVFGPADEAIATQRRSTISASGSTTSSRTPNTPGRRPSGSTRPCARPAP